MLNIKTPRSRLRLYAAAWTAVVAAIPAYIAAGTYNIAGEWIVPERIPLTLLAILAAGISGYWIGWRLIDPSGDHDSFGALFLGAAICLLSYYLLGVLVGLQHMVPLIVTTTTFTFPDLLEALIGIAACFVSAPAAALYFGIPTTGWYTVPIACIAGFVLSFRYRRRWARKSR